jgi:Zn-dependent M32 family carboxypeptidase
MEVIIMNISLFEINLFWGLTQKKQKLKEFENDFKEIVDLKKQNKPVYKKYKNELDAIIKKLEETK